LRVGFVEGEPGENVRRFALRSLPGQPGLSATSSPPSES
jgi:hypothetical protein